MDAVKGFLEDEGGSIALEFLSQHSQGDFRPFETVIRLPKKFGVLVAHDALELLTALPVAEQHVPLAVQALIKPLGFFQEARSTQL
jgi:hypothetical protein